ncbi:MAG: TonB-dependent receptor, partial [Saprospiraceae bacterium]
DHQSYFYPGVNAALVLSDMMPSLKNGGILNYAKLKGSYAQTGSVFALPGTTGAYQLESTFSQVGGFPYGTLPGFSADGSINNPLIKPETVRSTEVGLELGLFNSRIITELAYYFQDNNDQVVPIGISNSTGYAAALLNAARFENKGLEVDVKLTPFLKFGRFSWEMSGNYTYNTSDVISIYEGLDELFVGNTSYIIKGYPAYTHKLKDWLRDPQGRVIIDPVSGYPKQNPVNTYFGRTNPKHIVGITSEMNFKGLSLRAVAEYRGGAFIQNDIGRNLGFTGISNLSAINGRQRFVFPNSVIANADGSFTENKDIVVRNAHYSFLQDGAFTNVQTNYYSSADFWKLRELTLSYELPQSLMRNSKIVKRATLSLIGRNLIMFTPISNQWTDPEFSNTTGNAVGFTDSGQSPPTRVFGFNVNLTF